NGSATGCGGPLQRKDNHFNETVTNGRRPAVTDQDNNRWIYFGGVLRAIAGPLQ
ncbi:hypothetical protein HAX54_005899, partial [Datura stramonium]|nr:hypothetical protein [Datura stramonium]